LIRYMEMFVFSTLVPVLLTVSLFLNALIICEMFLLKRKHRRAVTLMNQMVSQVIVNSELSAHIAAINQIAGPAYGRSYTLVNRDFLQRLYGLLMFTR